MSSAPVERAAGPARLSRPTGGRVSLLDGAAATLWNNFLPAPRVRFLSSGRNISGSAVARTSRVFAVGKNAFRFANSGIFFLLAEGF